MSREYCKHLVPVEDHCRVCADGLDSYAEYHAARFSGVFQRNNRGATWRPSMTNERRKEVIRRLRWIAGSNTQDVVVDCMDLRSALEAYDELERDLAVRKDYADKHRQQLQEISALKARVAELERYVEHRTGCDPTAEARVRELEDKLRWYRTRAAKDQHAYSNLSSYWIEKLGEHIERGEAIRITREGMEGLLSILEERCK